MLVISHCINGSNLLVTLPQIKGSELLFSSPQDFKSAHKLTSDPGLGFACQFSSDQGRNLLVTSPQIDSKHDDIQTSTDVPVHLADLLQRSNQCEVCLFIPQGRVCEASDVFVHAANLSGLLNHCAISPCVLVISIVWTVQWNAAWSVHLRNTFCATKHLNSLLVAYYFSRKGIVCNAISCTWPLPESSDSEACLKKGTLLFKSFTMF